MIKNSIKLALALICLSAPISSAYPMAAANPVTKRAARELLKKGIEKGTTALHWAIAAGPLWIRVIKGFSSIPDKIKEDAEFSKALFTLLEFHKITDAKKELAEQEEWIREELKSQGFKNWNTVKLMPNFEWMAFSKVDEQMLMFPLSEITRLLREQKSITYKIKNFFGLANNDKFHILRGSLSHEKTHLQERHTEQVFVMSLLVPLITHKIWTRIFSPLKLAPVYSNFALRNAFKIITGMGKFITSSSVLWSMNYVHEIRADQGIIDDPQVLEAVAKHFRESYDSQKENRETSLLTMPDVHPHPLKRAQRLEERAAQLRAAQQKV